MFQSTQKYLAIVGIKSHPTIHKHSLNARCLLILILCSFFNTSSILYLFFVPTSFDQYIASINITATTIVNTIYFVVLLWKTAKLFEYIKNLENIVKIRTLELLNFFQLYYDQSIYRQS